MAVNISLQAIPNQAFSLTLGETRFAITLKEAVGVMVADVEIDGVVKLTGTRVLASEPIIPYAYLAAGNFILLTENDELPTWRQFGLSQSLVYMSAAELAAL